MDRRTTVAWGILALLALLSLACAAGGSRRGTGEQATPAAVAPATPTGTPTAVATAAPVVTETPPPAETSEDVGPSVRWRLDAPADGDGVSFSAVTGMDATAGLLLVADAYGGIFGFDLDGVLALLASPGEIGYVTDVAAGPDGTLYMADSALH